jgi:hypothetical protein
MKRQKRKTVKILLKAIFWLKKEKTNIGQKGKLTSIGDVIKLIVLIIQFIIWGYLYAYY